jgi:hypothetical protein
MVDKPTTADEEQRRRQTEVSRKQSGLPPEPESGNDEERGEGAGERADTDRRVTPANPR